MGRETGKWEEEFETNNNNFALIAAQLLPRTCECKFVMFGLCGIGPAPPPL